MRHQNTGTPPTTLRQPCATSMRSAQINSNLLTFVLKIFFISEALVFLTNDVLRVEGVAVFRAAFDYDVPALDVKRVDFKSLSYWRNWDGLVKMKVCGQARNSGQTWALPHMMALVNSSDGVGDVYVWGYNVCGQCGTGDTNTVPDALQLPVNRSYFDNSIIDIACGPYSSIVLTASNSMYMWGCYPDPNNPNSYSVESMIPKKIPGKFSKIFSSIYDQIFALTLNGDIYMYGMTYGFYYECHAVPVANISTTAFVAPRQGKIYPNVHNFSTITTGWYGSFGYSENTKSLLSWGENELGQIGYSDNYCRFSPDQLFNYSDNSIRSWFHGNRLVQAATGFKGSVVMDDKGYLYLTGFGVGRLTTMNFSAPPDSLSPIFPQLTFKAVSVSSVLIGVALTTTGRVFGWYYNTAQCISQELEGTDCPWNDILDFANSNVTDCANQCNKNDSCVSWVFSPSETRCWFKTSCDVTWGIHPDRIIGRKCNGTSYIDPNPVELEILNNYDVQGIEFDNPQLYIWATCKWTNNITTAPCQEISLNFSDCAPLNAIITYSDDNEICGNYQKFVYLNGNIVGIQNITTNLSNSITFPNDLVLSGSFDTSIIPTQIPQINTSCKTTTLIAFNDYGINNSALFREWDVCGVKHNQTIVFIEITIPATPAPIVVKQDQQIIISSNFFVGYNASVIVAGNLTVNGNFNLGEGTLTITSDSKLNISGCANITNSILIINNKNTNNNNTENDKTITVLNSSCIIGKFALVDFGAHSNNNCPELKYALTNIEVVYLHCTGSPISTVVVIGAVVGCVVVVVAVTTIVLFLKRKEFSDGMRTIKKAHTPDNATQ